MKAKLVRIGSTVFVLLALALFVAPKTAHAAGPYYSRASAAWAVNSTWSTVGCGGAAAGAYPVAGETVTICSGNTVTLAADAAAGSITISAMTAAGTNGLTVGAYKLDANSISIAGSGTGSRYSTLSVSTGTINVTGNISFSGTAAQARLTFSGAGTLNIQGNLGASGTFAASTGTVNFNGSSAQTAAGYTYNVLKSNNANASGVTLVAAATITTLTIGDVTANSVFNDGGFVITPGASSVLNLTSGTYNLGSAGTATTWPAWGTRNITAGTTVGYVSGAAQAVSITPSYPNLTFSGAGTKTPAAGTLTVGGNLTVSAGTLALDTNNNVVNVTGNINISGGTFSRGTGSVTCAGLTITGTMDNTSSTGSVTVNGNVSGAGTLTTGGTARVFNVTGNWTFSGTVSSGDGIALTMNGTGAQTLSGAMCNATATNCTLTINKASGTVTLGSNITLNGSATSAFTLTAGTFDASTFLLTATTPTLTAGTLRVGAAAWATNYSFTTTPTPAAGFTIEYYNANPTINAAITYQNLQFSGSGTAGASGALTIQGNLTNTGGGTLNFGANNVTLSGTVAANNIAGFTTTGTVLMTKTGGTATFTGNVNGGALTINGSGGTLNLGAGLTHTFTGTWTRTAGTLNGGSSTLNLGGGLSGTGGTFTASTGTVNYNAAGAQTVAGVTYNNLTLSGSGAKTTTGATVNGILSMEGTATTTGTIPTYGGAATLQYQGSAAQTTGTEFPATWTGTGGVIINNASGVTLNASKTINTALALTLGDLSTGANTLTMGQNATTSGNYDVVGSASTVSSVCRGAFGGTGDNTYGSAYTKVSGFATTPTSMCVRLIKQLPSNSGLEEVVVRDYTLTMNGGSVTSGNVQLHYRDTSDTTGAGCSTPGCPTNLSQLMLWRWNGTRWALQGGSNGGSGDSSYVSATGVTAFSPWGIAQSSPTAVTLSTFNAHADNASSGAILVLGLAVSGTFAVGAGWWLMRRRLA